MLLRSQCFCVCMSTSTLTIEREKLNKNKKKMSISLIIQNATVVCVYESFRVIVFFLSKAKNFSFLAFDYVYKDKIALWPHHIILKVKVIFYIQKKIDPILNDFFFVLFSHRKRKIQRVNLHFFQVDCRILK